MPYSSLVITGPNRGTSHCYICETADKPAVIVFARSQSDALGKLAGALDKALGKHKDADLRAWATFLHPDHTAVDAKIMDWSRKHAVSTMPLTVFEDSGGPPSYKLPADADVTVLLYVNQKVAASFSCRPGELTESKIDEVLKALPQLLKKK